MDGKTQQGMASIDDNVAFRHQGNTSSSHNDRLTKNEMCGCYLIGYPRLLQRLTSYKHFIFIISLQMALVGIFGAIYESSLTTLETRYQMSISELGLLTSAFTGGTVVSTVFVTHFGGRPTSRRPVWLAVSGLCVTIGVLLHTLPQFIFSAFTTSALIEPSDMNTSYLLTRLCDHDAGVMERVQEDGGFCQVEERQILYENHIAFITFIIAEILVGMGYGPLVPISLSYIHESAGTATTGLVSGLFESLYGFGSIIGFQIGSAVLSLWVDYYRVDVSKINLTPYDYEWVGAWWMGFLIVAIMYGILSLPLFLFPNQIPANRGDAKDIAKVEGEHLDKKKDQEAKTSSTLTDLKDWPRSVWRLLKNSVFCLVCLTYITETGLLYALLTFLPKYLQDQFQLDIFTSGAIVGLAIVPAWAAGALIGGILVKVLNMKMRSSALLCTIVSLLGTAFTVTLIFVGCLNLPMAGVNVGYQGNNLQEVGLHAQCNSECNCQPEPVLTPLCGPDGITYFSACHAGCSEVSENETYTGCSCLDYSFASLASTPITNGHCESDCSSTLTFVVLAVFWIFSMALATAPRNVITLSAVDYSDTSFALGLSRVLMQLLGALPFPLVFGICIDSACTVWQTLCGERGYCYVYDIEKFRVIVFGLTTGILAVQSLAFFLILVVVLRRNEPLELESKEEHVNEAFSTVEL